MMNVSQPNRVRFGPYEFDFYTHELWKHGTRLKLVGQPLEILRVMVTRPGQLVTREELRAELWPADTFVDFNHGLNAAVNKLRDALCDSAEDPRYIETLPRRGYRFLAAVEYPAAEGASPSAADSAPHQSGTVPAVQPLETAPVPEPSFPSLNPPLENRPRSRWIRVLVPAAVLVVIFLVWGAGSLVRWTHQSFRAARAPAMPVVSLTNLADPTSDPAFSPDGKMIAFRREGYTPGTSGIYVKPVGGFELLQLTSNPSDCCPVWSPSGNMIAFSHYTEFGHEIYTVPSSGGAARKVYSTGVGTKRGELDWSPDGQSIAFVGQFREGTSSIFLLSMKNFSVRRLTEPPLLNNDRGPIFSPDGEHLAFIRTRENGLPEDLMLMPAGGGESTIIKSWYNGILGPPAWSADGESILFAAGQPSLFRVPVSGGDVAPVTAAGDRVWRPAVARRGYRLAYQQISRAVSIWQMDLDQNKPAAHTVVATDSGRNEGAQVSPDGRKLAFMSDRSGNMDIWISDRDGGNPLQLTAMTNTGTPRWSPDGRFIAFDADWQSGGSIFVVDINGGPPKLLIGGKSNNLVPSWSQDGKWIYFGSDRSGGWQVWKVPATGGDPIQVTAHGGFAAWESSNGRMLFYSKLNMPNPEIWKVPAGGGPEVPVSPLVRPETWASWALVDRGIYFVENDITGEPIVTFYDFATGKVSRNGTLDKMPFWLSATPDGKSVLYEHLDQENSHIMLLENFR